MNRFLTKVLFPKLILFFSGLQHRTEGESHSTSFFSAILMQVWKICNFFFAIQAAETWQCACVLFSLYICILSYDEYTNHSKAPEKKKKKMIFFPTVVSLFDTARLKMVVVTLTGHMHLHADTWDVNTFLLHSSPRFFPKTRLSLTASYMALTEWKALTRVKEDRRKASCA